MTDVDDDLLQISCYTLPTVYVYESQLLVFKCFNYIMTCSATRGGINPISIGLDPMATVLEVSISNNRLSRRYIDKFRPPDPGG